MANLAGFNGKATIAAVDLHVIEWDLKFDVELLDSTNCNAGGKRTFLPGLQTASGSLKMNYDTSVVASGSGPITPLANQSGQLILTLVDAASSTHYTFTSPTTLFSNQTITNTVAGIVTYSADWSAAAGWSEVAA